MKRYRFIQAEKSNFPIVLLCKVMEVSRPAYYEWLHRPKSNLQRVNELLEVHIRELFRKHRRKYGSPRITIELRKMGFRVGENRIARLMRENGLFARIPRKSKRSLQTKGANIAPHLLRRDFNPEKPNLVWTGDITYLYTTQGTIYLSVILDLFSRKIVGFDLADKMDVSLVERSLKMAIKNR